MRRMRRIPFDMGRRLQNSNEAHIEALGARHADGQRLVRLQGHEAGDLAHHGLGHSRPVFELAGCDALFEAEEDWWGNWLG